jgi:hypothetical protein
VGRFKRTPQQPGQRSAGSVITPSLSDIDRDNHRSFRLPQPNGFGISLSAHGKLPHHHQHGGALRCWRCCGVCQNWIETIAARGTRHWQRIRRSRVHDERSSRRSASCIRPGHWRIGGAFSCHGRSVCQNKVRRCLAEHRVISGLRAPPQSPCCAFALQNRIRFAWRPYCAILDSHPLPCLVFCLHRLSSGPCGLLVPCVPPVVFRQPCTAESSMNGGNSLPVGYLP